MPRRFDAVVVGAGPAGSIAAFEIASAGYSVLLLEKHKKAGLPLCCAEAVSKVPFDKIITPRENWINSRISRICLFSPQGRKVTVIHKDAGYILDRTVFDHELSLRAAGAGAVFETETIGLELKGQKDRFTGLQIVKPGGESEVVEAGIFIAADGVESKIARLSGIANLIEGEEIESLIQYRVENIDITPDSVEFHMGNQVAPLGYIWIFPKSTHSANIGVGISAEREQGAHTSYYLDKFLKKRFAKYKVSNVFCGIVPRYQGPGKLRLNNLLVVGDAARVLDSLTGAGIVNAMLSGKYAGQAAAIYLSGQIKTIKEIDDYYPALFLKEKQSELELYLKLRNIYNHLDDNDFEEIIGTIAKRFDGKRINDINAIKELIEIVRSRPRLLRLARYLI